MAVQFTYVPIATQTVTSGSSLTFSSIPQGYQDLVIVGNGYANTGTNDASMYFNGDNSSGLYSRTIMDGNGSSATSARQTGANYIYLNYNGYMGTSSSPAVYTIHLQNYSSSSIYKTALMRTGNPSVALYAGVGLWRNTAPITSFTFQIGSNSFASVTFTLYGLAAA